MPASMPPRPIFGPPDDSLLGDQTVFCRQLVEKVNLNTGATLDAADPVNAIRSLSRAELLRMWAETQEVLTLDDLVPVQLNDTDIDAVLARAEGNVAVCGDEGSAPPRDVVARMIVQLEALEKVCAPSKKWSLEKRTKLDNLKAKYDRILK